jgi:hypothetical protein
MELNERVIKISGSANINQDLQLSHDYTIGLTANCFRVEDFNNEDGTFDKVYKLKMLGQVVVSNDRGQKLVAKVKVSKSQKLRWLIEQNGLDYDAEMDKIMNNYK